MEMWLVRSRYRRGGFESENEFLLMCGFGSQICRIMFSDCELCGEHD